jgi:hypothetical protein
MMGLYMKKLTKGQSKLLQAAGEGGFLRRTVIDGEEVFFTDKGCRVNRRTVKKLIEAGKIVPVGDGLFEGDTQSYEAA